MNSSTLELQTSRIRAVSFTRTMLSFALDDGRSVLAPLHWFPRLEAGTAKERNHWELIGIGHGIHWPDLDEDVSVENLLMGRRSMESERSFRAWLSSRSTPERSGGIPSPVSPLRDESNPTKPNRTHGVKILVESVLGTIVRPYSEDVTDEVCQAIEAKPEWSSAYRDLCIELNAIEVNKAIGRWVSRAVGRTGQGHQFPAKSSLIESYSKLYP